MTFLKRYFGVFVVLLLSFWAIKALFAPGFFSIHDDEQIGRLFELDKSLRAGHIPPRIVPNLGFGYGYPFFNFYPPFAYYIAEIFSLMGFSYIVSTKLMIGLGFILGSFFMYLLSKEFFGKLGGLISAVLYTYAPYHAVDVYVRGALPEFWSMVFLPAIFWSYYKLAKTFDLKFLILAGLFNAGLILSHNLVALMAVPFVLAWLIFLFLNLDKNKQKFVVYSILSILLGLSLTAYFWLPSYFEKQYTMVDLLTTELASYNQHFVYLRQLWDSPWGYGGSIYGLYDGLSFQIGKIHLALTLLGSILLLYLFKRKSKTYILLSVFYLLFFVSIFMTTFYSKFVWDSIQPLWYIQFPWRFLLFCAFTSSFIAGSIFTINFSKVIKFTIAGLILFVVIYSYKDFFQPQKYFLDAKDKDYTSLEKLRWDTSRIAAEYVPKGIATKKSDINTTIIDIDKKDIAKKSFQVVSGDMVVTEIQNFPHEKKYFLSSNEKSILRINTYSFPGWKTYVDGKEISYTDNNKLKLITLGPFIGSHILIVKFTDTTIRSLGNWISLTSIITLIIGSLLNKFKNLNLRKDKAVL